MKLRTFRYIEPSERENIVVHIGTRPNKNPHISIEALRTLREKGHIVRLVTIGSPTNLPQIEGVEYRYAVSEEEKLELLRRAKALILPSRYEGFSYVVLEAMMYGTPVIVSNAVPEEVVINSFNGIGINSFDPVDYANVLEILLSNEDLWLSLSRNGLEFIKRLDYIGIAKKYIAIIRQLL